MKDQMIQIAHVELGPEEIRAADTVLRSGNLSQGKMVHEFEDKFAEYCGSRFAIACSSGTAALYLAYRSIIDINLQDLSKTPDILVPTFSHISTLSMILEAGGNPMLCDIDPDTLLADYTDIDIGRHDALALVNLFGNMAHTPKCTELPPVVWDSCQAHGTTMSAVNAGAFRELVCFSFYPTKNMHTGGEGGMVTTNSIEYYTHMDLLRSHGQDYKYHHSMFGWNLRMTEVAAAIGIEQLKKLPNMINRRQTNAEYIKSCLPGIKWQKITDGCVSSYHQLTMIHPDRDALAEHLKANNIQTAVHYPRCIHQQPAVIDLAGTMSLPNAEYAADHVLSIPCHPFLSVADLTHIVATIGDTL